MRYDESPSFQSLRRRFPFVTSILGLGRLNNSAREQAQGVSQRRTPSSGELSFSPAGRVGPPALSVGSMYLLGPGSRGIRTVREVPSAMGPFRDPRPALGLAERSLPRRAVSGRCPLTAEPYFSSIYAVYIFSSFFFFIP